MKKTDDWKDRLIAQQEETILWQAKRISELIGQQFAMVGQPEHEITNLERHERNVQQLFGERQPEQEPVAFLTNRRQRLNVEFNTTGLTLMPKSIDWKIPLYTTPPQRTWVGMRDSQKLTIIRDCSHLSIMQLIELVEEEIRRNNNA